MANLYITGFENGYGRGIVGGQGLNPTTRYNYGRGYTTNNNEVIYYPVNHADITVGTALLASGVSAGGDIIRFYGDDAATLHITINWSSTDNKVRIYRGTTAGTLLATSSGMVTPAIWNYWECRAVLNDTTGSVEVKCNGVTVVSASGVDTKNAGTTTVFTRVYFQCTNGHGNVWDDQYVNDGSGGVDDTFWGEITVKTLVPNANGNSSQFIGSDGNSTDNYLLVDEAFNALPNTSDYNGSGTPGQKDTYNLTDLPAGSPIIKGVQVGVYVAKSDAGTISCRRVMRTASTDYTGADLALSASYQWFWEWFRESPAGGAWSKTTIDALEVGIEVRA